MKHLLIFVLLINGTLCGYSQSIRNIDPKVKILLDDLNAYDGPPLEKLPLEVARQSYVDMQYGYDYEFTSTLNTQFIEQNGIEVKISIVKPKRSSEPLPTFLYFHGGGWVLGGLETHERLVRNISENANVAVVFVHYSLAPESKYPVAIDEGYAVLKWIRENGAKEGLDITKLAIGGDSAGGNLAIAISFMLDNKTHKELYCQLLFCPITDTTTSSQSYQMFADKHYLTRSSMEWFFDSYLSTSTLSKKYIVAPLRIKKSKLRKMPPTLVITVELDVLRDEGEAFAEKLKDAGVETISKRFNGTVHDFMVLNWLADTPASIEAVDLACRTLQDAFYKN
ncbi:alpha/beta hydrolase [Reichenbachiella versicolor]|uniref:alpha/beta hydrolase n=1 Tax=Reichenbachiella versicolor TaxID=1821036 RepID=UPI000D6DEF5C|nr:alpha/beta hydrolase [Reichenbachiella versicolor]